MAIYSLYIFDRHCSCVFYHDWQRATPVRAGPGVLDAVMRAPAASVVAPSQRFSTASVGTVNTTSSTEQPGGASAKALPFDEEAKLVYGVVFSLKNMVRRLSGREVDAFHSFRTSAYKLHYFETPTGYRFIMMSDPGADSLRFVLQRLYNGAFLEYVVRNPLIGLDSAKTGRGIDSDAFRSAVDSFIKGLSAA